MTSLEEHCGAYAASERHGELVTASIRRHLTAELDRRNVDDPRAWRWCEEWIVVETDPSREPAESIARAAVTAFRDALRR